MYRLNPDLVDRVLLFDPVKSTARSLLFCCLFLSVYGFLQFVLARTFIDVWLPNLGSHRLSDALGLKQSGESGFLEPLKRRFVETVRVTVRLAVAAVGFCAMFRLTNLAGGCVKSKVFGGAFTAAANAAARAVAAG